MVKRRENKTHSNKAQIDRFVEQADKTNSEELNPKAPHNYKSIAIPFNEYEFHQLELVCEKTGRSKNSLIRFLILQYAQKVQEEGEGL